MFIPIATVAAILGVFIYFWWFGHKSSWGILAHKYPADSSVKRLESTNRKKESVNLKVNEKWKQGWNAIQISLNESGCHLMPEPIFRFFIPSISIPWRNVKEVRKDSLFSIDQIEISLKDSNISLFLPLHYLKHCEGFIESSRREDKDKGSEPFTG